MNAGTVYRWTRFAARVVRSNFEGAPRPYKLMFVVTKRCHSRCTYCDIWKAKDDPVAMAQELTLAEIESVAAANPHLQWIDFTGGEPTDRPDFPELVRAFSERCPDLLLVHFPTNGIATKRILGITESLLGFLRAKLVVSVSIDGPPELNDRLRGVRNDFVHAIATFSALRRIVGENVYVGMTLHGRRATCGMSTTELVEATFAAVNAALQAEAAPPIAWAQFHVNLPHLSEHYYGNGAPARLEGDGARKTELLEAMHRIIERNGLSLHPMRLLEHVYRRHALDYIATGRTPVRCGATHSTVYLSERGVVYPCSIWNHALGHVREDGFDLGAILARAKAAGVRRAIVDGKCPHCWTPCEAYPALAGNLLRLSQRGRA